MKVCSSVIAASSIGEPIGNLKVSEVKMRLVDGKNTITACYH
jgi:hypothetical protein